MVAGIAGERDMPDTPVAPHDGGPYDPVMEARVSRLEEDMREVKATLPRMEASIIRIETMLAATLPHLATKADVAELRTEMKADYTSLRTEMKADNDDLRVDTKADNASLRTELAELRTETKADNASVRTEIADLRTDMKSDYADLKTELKSDIARLEVALADKPGRTYLWAVLAVLLTAYACGLAGLAVLK
jgi:chromosome segregation ATPase